MKTKRWRLLIALFIVVVLAAFSVLMYTRWNVSLDYVPWTWRSLLLGPDRLIWEDQVLSPDEILPGQILTFHDHGEKREIAIMSKPYELDGRCRLDFVFLPITWETYYINNTSCAYVGLESYVNGWHQFNHLSDTVKGRLNRLEITFLDFWLIRDEVYSQLLPVIYAENCIPKVIDGRIHNSCFHDGTVEAP